MYRTLMSEKCLNGHDSTNLFNKGTPVCGWGKYELQTHGSAYP